MALFSPTILSLFLYLSTALANHGLDTSDLHPEGATKLSSTILSLYSDLSAFDKEDPDVVHFAGETEPALDLLFAEKKSETEIAHTVAGFLGTLNPTQLRTLEIEIGKLLPTEWTTEPPNKKYIALLQRLLRAKELRRGLDRTAPMNKEVRYDADLRAFDEAFKKAQKDVAEHSAEFHHYLEEAKKSPNGRAIFLHKYPNAMAFLDKERRTNLEKVKDEPVLTQGQVYANHGLAAMAQADESGEYVLPVILASGKIANVRLGSDPKAFYEKLEEASTHVPRRWSGVQVAARVHPQGTRWIEDPEPTEEPTKPEQEEVAAEDTSADQTTPSVPTGRNGGAHLYVPAPPNAIPTADAISKSSVFLEDATGGDMGLVSSPGALTPHVKTLIVEVKGKHYSIDRPFERKDLALDPSLFWFWKADLTPELKAELAKSGADTTGLKTVPVKGFLAMPIKYSDKLKLEGSGAATGLRNAVGLTPEETAAKTVLEKKCASCHTDPKNGALNKFPIPGSGGWIAFLRNSQRKKGVRDAAVDPDTRWMPPEETSALTNAELQSLQAWTK